MVPLAPKVPAEAVFGTVPTAVRRQGEGGVGEGDGLVMVGVDVVVRDVAATLVQSPHDLGVVAGHPQVVVADIA